MWFVLPFVSDISLNKGTFAPSIFPNIEGLIIDQCKGVLDGTTSIRAYY